MAVVEDDFEKDLSLFNNVNYQQILIEKLELKRILKNLTFLSKEEKELIISTEKDKGSCVATKCLLHVLNANEERNWFRIFKDAIKEEEFEYLSKLFERYGDDIEDQKEFYEFINTIAPDLLRKIEPENVVVYLKKQEIVNEIDYRTIKAANTTDGNFAVNLMLLSHINRKAENWFPKTLWAFKEAGYEHLFETDFPRLKDTETVAEVLKIVAKWKEENSKLNEASQNKESGNNLSGENAQNSSIDKYQLKDTEESSVQNLEGGNNGENSQETNDITQKTTLELRPYQVELAKDAKMGENCLIQAPTGCGKTHVALEISQHHLSQNNKHLETGKRKVAFLVPYTFLVHQQWTMYKKFVDYKSIGLRGASKPGERIHVGDCAKENDIIIMTPQLLVDAIRKKHVESLNVFTLLIFDECHHTWGGDPFMKIMKIYLKNKKQMAQLPQIIGLTASVGVGKKSDTVQKAKEHILKLCANLDCKIVQVTKEVSSLEEFFNNPTEELFEVEERLQDPFYKKICHIMTYIEEEMRFSPHVMSVTKDNIFEDQMFDDMLRSKGKPGSTQYKQWVNQLDNQISKIPDERRGVFVVCLSHLRVHTNALEIHKDCRSIDAINFIENMFNSNYDYREKIKQWNTDHLNKRLYIKFRDCVTDLKRLCLSYPNPKLEVLKRYILRFTSGSLGSRGIVVCKTLNLSVALLKWAQEDCDFKQQNIKVDRLVGTRSSTEQGGMTVVQQEYVLKQFKEGKTRLLIATTFEGMDVPECNFDIVYEHATDVITRIQARGRTRADMSNHLALSSLDSGNIEREKHNKFQEELMKSAIADVLKMSKQEFQQRINVLQKNISLEDSTKMKQPHISNAENFMIKCKRCDRFVCYAKDIRTHESAHHLVLDPSLYDRVELNQIKKPATYDDLTKTHKLICNKIDCSQDWGVNVLFNKTKLPNLKQGNALVYFDVELNQSNSLSKWTNLPFEIHELEDEELFQYKKELLERSLPQESKSSTIPSQTDKEIPLSEQEKKNLTAEKTTNGNVLGKRVQVVPLQDQIKKIKTNIIQPKSNTGVDMVTEMTNTSNLPQQHLSDDRHGVLVQPLSTEQDIQPLPVPMNVEKRTSQEAERAVGTQHFEHALQSDHKLTEDEVQTIFKDLAPSVCRIQINNIPVGSGFLVGSLKNSKTHQPYWVLLTCYHLDVIDALNKHNNCEADFGFRSNRVGPIVTVAIKGVVASDKDLDYAFLYLDYSQALEDYLPSNQELGKKILYNQEPKLHEPLFILGHTGGNALTLDPSVYCTSKPSHISGKQFIFYQSSSLHGASGSPCFALRSMKLYAIHHGGDIGPAKHVGSSSNVECGIKLWEIMNHIKADVQRRHFGDKSQQMISIGDLYKIFPQIKP